MMLQTTSKVLHLNNHFPLVKLYFDNFKYGLYLTTHALERLNSIRYYDKAKVKRVKIELIWKDLLSFPNLNKA